MMNEVARATRREYQRAWRRKNKDKVRAINERYWLKRAEKQLAAQAQAEAEGGKAE